MAEKGAMVITWGAPIATQPSGKGLEVFGNALTYYDELAKEGRISGYRVFASTAREHGILVIEGEISELARLSTEPESLTLLAMASAVVEDVRTEICIGGKPDDVAGFYTRTLEALTKAGLVTT